MNIGRRDLFRFIMGGTIASVLTPISIFIPKEPTTQIPRFRSGEILTCNDLNRLVDRINALEKKV